MLLDFKPKKQKNKNSEKALRILNRGPTWSDLRFKNITLALVWSTDSKRAGGAWVIIKEATAVAQVNDDGSLDQGGCGWDVKNWFD